MDRLAFNRFLAISIFVFFVCMIIYGILLVGKIDTLTEKENIPIEKYIYSSRADINGMLLNIQRTKIIDWLTSYTKNEEITNIIFSGNLR